MRLPVLVLLALAGVLAAAALGTELASPVLALEAGVAIGVVGTRVSTGRGGRGPDVDGDLDGRVDEVGAAFDRMLADLRQGAGAADDDLAADAAARAGQDVLGATFTAMTGQLHDMIDRVAQTAEAVGVAPEPPPARARLED